MGTLEKYLEQTNSQKSTQTSPTNDQATNSPLLAHNNGHLNDVGSPIDFLNNNVITKRQNKLYFLTCVDVLTCTWDRL